MPGIYELKGDTLKVCFAKPGQNRPTEFTTKQGTGFLYCLYKRQIDGGGPAGWGKEKYSKVRSLGNFMKLGAIQIHNTMDARHHR